MRSQACSGVQLREVRSTSRISLRISEADWSMISWAASMSVVNFRPGASSDYCQGTYYWVFLLS